MKFTVKTDFLHGTQRFEEGNAHNGAKLGLSDDEVLMFYNAGWVEVEGKDPAPALDPHRVVTLEVQSSKLGTKAAKVGG